LANPLPAPLCLFTSLIPIIDNIKPIIIKKNEKTNPAITVPFVYNYSILLYEIPPFNWLPQFEQNLLFSFCYPPQLAQYFSINIS